jgi:photosystem II stability/assembly factor-like uncharacterized protein
VFDTTTVFSLAISSNGHIFVGSNLGISRSTDNGDSWTQVNPITGIRSLTINSSGHIFAAWGAIYRSTDNGNTWTRLYPISGSISVYALAINSSGHIFAGTQFVDGILRSTDNGETWTPVNTGLTNRNIYALTINSKGHIFAASYYDGVFRSMDNGESWTPVNTGLTTRRSLSLAVNPSGYLFVGTGGGGVFRSVQLTTVTSVKEIPDEIPTSFSLEQNYPNPFNPTTSIGFHVSSFGFVSLKVFDVLGREVATLVDEYKTPGQYQVEFDGGHLSSGVYFYRLHAGHLSETKRMILLR